eukprot:3152626-Pleurochrysis_carterae.AAC.1
MGMNEVVVGVRAAQPDLHRLLTGLQLRMMAKPWFQICVGVRLDRASGDQLRDAQGDQWSKKKLASGQPARPSTGGPSDGVEPPSPGLAAGAAHTLILQACSPASAQPVSATATDHARALGTEPVLGFAEDE